MIKVDTMRFVDRYAGQPVCWLLTLIRIAVSPFGRRVPPRPRKVLIIKFSEMGSTVLACPAFAELERHIAGLELLFLTFSTNRPMMDRLGTPGRVFEIDVSSAWRLILSSASAIARLRRERIDTSIDLDFFSRLSAIFAYLVCRGNRVGFHRFTGEGLGRGGLLTHRVMYSPHVHTSAAFLALARALLSPDPDGLSVREPVDPSRLTLPEYRPGPAAAEAVRRTLSDAGIPADARLVLVNPNSSDLFPLRRWPLERFAEFSARLVARYSDVALVITGTESERQDAQAILDRVHSPRCVSFAGRTTFAELLALYGAAAVLVTNDSGPAHFAALLRLPSVVLFGPETPALYSPLNPNARCLYAHYTCSPCVSVYNAKKSPCTRSVCLEAISVDEVLSNVSAFL
jgi:ADP-heptose:LPS heptosyltransferase